jgi:hypothetical protein
LLFRNWVLENNNSYVISTAPGGEGGEVDVLQYDGLHVPRVQAGVPLGPGRLAGRTSPWDCRRQLDVVSQLLHI